MDQRLKVFVSRKSLYSHFVISSNEGYPQVALKILAIMIVGYVMLSFLHRDDKLRGNFKLKNHFNPVNL